MRILFRSKYKTHVKVYILFLLSLGIPSLILGFLALRGIKNDRALAEQEILRQHEDIAGTLIRQIETDFHQIEVTLNEFLLSHRSFAETDLHILAQQLKSSEPFVDVVFAVKPNALVFPSATLLYNRPEPAGFPRTDHVSQRMNQLIQTAERLEFVEKEYVQAKSTYEQAFSSASSTDLQADLLLRVGRTAKKAERIHEAINAYERLIKDYDQIALPGRLPLGLAARLELPLLYLGKSDTSKAISSIFETYRALSDRRWRASRSQFEFATAQIKDIWQQVTGQRPQADSTSGAVFNSLIKKIDAGIVLTERLFRIESHIYPLIKERLGLIRSSETSNHRLSVGVGTALVPVVLAVAPPGRQDNLEAIGVLFNEEIMASEYLPPILDDLPLPNNSSVLLKNDQGDVIIGSIPSTSARMTLAKSLVGNFPPWSIELYQEDPQFFEDLLQSRRSNYAYFLALILGILVFGVILALRMMSREMKLAKLKSDFVSTVSHEFRSPLTSIRQLAEMLQAGRVPSEERRQHYYQVILEQSERLSHLVTNTLELDRIESGVKELEYETVDLPRLLTDVVTKMQQQTKHEGYVITLDYPPQLPMVRLDPQAITQVLNNLLDNAIKYSGNNKDVAVRVHIEKREVIIAVKDHGPGINKEELGKIFDRFYRGGDELTRTVKGSGLGLALVRQLVEAHQGSVTAQSEPGQGSIFSIRLPLEVPEEQ